MTDERNAGDERVGSSLRARRPIPSRQFSSSLRERLVASELRARRPERLWLLVVAYVACGAVLLLLAALGA